MTKVEVADGYKHITTLIAFVSIYTEMQKHNLQNSKSKK